MGLDSLLVPEVAYNKGVAVYEPRDDMRIPIEFFKHNKRNTDHGRPMSGKKKAKYLKGKRQTKGGNNLGQGKEKGEMILVPGKGWVPKAKQG